jgi:citrate synthase
MCDLLLPAGIHKTKYWEPAYEDSMNLLGKLPGLAATIYNNTYKGGKQIPIDPNLDWAANLAVMMGQDKSSMAALDMMRMYQTIHAGAQYIQPSQSLTLSRTTASSAPCS